MRAISIPDGPFTRALDQVPFTNQNLVVIVGKDENDQPVLVPHIELIARVQQEGDQHTNVSVTVPLENATYLLSDICKDFARISNELEGMANPKCSLEPQRVEYCLEFLKEAVRDLEKSTIAFERMRLSRGL